MDLLVNFDDLQPNNKALKKLVQAFTRAGAPVATIDTDGRAKRSSGVSYRDVVMTFVDNQKLAISFKQSGDVFQIKLNGSVVPLTNQSDQLKAVAEIVRMLDSGRTKFQAKLARQAVKLPSTLKTAAPRLEVKLQDISVGLDESIATAKARVDELKAQLGITTDGTDKMALDSAVMDSVEGDNGRVDIEFLLAQAKFIIDGGLLDDTAAIATLKISLENVLTNYPIHVAEGDIEQADLEKSSAESFKQAIAILEQSAVAA